MSLILGILILVMAALTLMGTGATAHLVGKPRAPLTESQAGGRILLALLYVVILVWAGVLLIVH